MAQPHRNLVGQRFGRLVVESYAGKSEWNCICDCGADTIVLTERLNKGHTRSCGCLHREAKQKHGMANTKTYHAWQQIRQRCTNPNDTSYHNYGGRGVTICDRWQSFAAFFEDMGEKPEGAWLDRLDNSKGYSPDNCEWVTPKQNQNNKRSNRVIEYRGRSQTIAQWADELGFNYRTLNNRINRGWTIERALTKPAGKDQT